MTGFLFALLVICLGLFAGVAPAGEGGVMAMRGNPPDGTQPFNRLDLVRAGGARAEASARLSAAAPVIDAPAAPGPSGRTEAYLPWRDNCVRAPLLIAGQAVRMDCPADFGRVPRFVQAVENVDAGFFRFLARELATNRDGGESGSRSAKPALLP